MMSTDILFDLQRSEQVITHKKPIPSSPVVDEREAPISSVSNDGANRVYQMRQLYDKTDIGRHDQKDFSIPPRHPQSSDGTVNDAGMQGICIQGSMTNLKLNGKLIKKPSRSHALAARMSAAKAIYAAQLSDRTPHRINNFDNNGGGSISSISINSTSSADASIPSTTNGFDNDGFSVNQEADIDQKVDLSMFGEPFFIPDSCPPRSAAPSSHRNNSEMRRMSEKVSIISSTKQRPVPEQVNSASTSSRTHGHNDMPSSWQPMDSNKYNQTLMKTRNGTSIPPMPRRAQTLVNTLPIQDSSESSIGLDLRQAPVSSYKVGSDRRASRINRMVSTIDGRVVPVGTHKGSAVYNEEGSVEIAQANPTRYRKANLRRTKANHKHVKNLNEPGEESSLDAVGKTIKKDHDFLQDSIVPTKSKGIVQQRLEMMKATGVFKSERIANEREEAARAEAEAKQREENRIAAVEARNRLRAKRRAAAERAEEKRTTEKRAEEEKHEGERTATKKALAQRIEAVRKAAAEKAAAEAKAAEEATPKTESERKVSELCCVILSTSDNQPRSQRMYTT